MGSKVALEPSSECGSCTRRGVLHGIGIAIAGSLVACGGGGGSPDIDAAVSSDADPGSCASNEICLDLTTATYAALRTVGGAVVIQHGTAKIIVVRTSTTAVAALSAICTHQGCIVKYQTSNMLLVCPCHGAQFALTGRVVRGPATRPVQSYVATVSDTTVTIVVA